MSNSPIHFSLSVKITDTLLSQLQNHRYTSLSASKSPIHSSLSIKLPIHLSLSIKITNTFLSQHQITDTSLPQHQNHQYIPLPASKSPIRSSLSPHPEKIRGLSGAFLRFPILPVGFLTEPIPFSQEGLGRQNWAENRSPIFGYRFSVESPIPGTVKVHHRYY